MIRRLQNDHSTKENVVSTLTDQICLSIVSSGIPWIKIQYPGLYPTAVSQTKFQTRDPNYPIRRWIDHRDQRHQMVAVVHPENSKGLSREVRITDSPSFDDGTYVLALDEKKLV